MANSISITKTDFSLPLIQVKQSDIAEIISDLQGVLGLVTDNEEDALSIPCVISMDEAEVEPTFLARLLETFRQFGLLPIGVKTVNDHLAEQANYAGLAVFNDKMNQLDLFGFSVATQDSIQDKIQTSRAENQPQPETALANHRLHTEHVVEGEQIYAEGCDLIVLGDVEKGAEVIADGNIYIGGSLYGKAYAGNSGLMNIDQISVRAYAFEPELVSIAGFYQLLEDIPSQYKGLAVKAQFVAQKLQYSVE